MASRASCGATAASTAPEAMDEYTELLRRRKLPIIGDDAGVWSLIHLDDAAGATLAAIDRGRPGTFNVVDDDQATAAE
jgi:2-alkyl-3-oxoalkanoate reductase